jgi:hypothetical protein
MSATSSRRKKQVVTPESTKSNPAKKALRRAVHLRKVEDRMREQFAILKDFFSDQIAPLEETSGTVSDDDGMGPSLDHQTQASNRRLLSYTFSKRHP